MAGVLLRNVVGFLVQMVPCAVLCLMPFGNRFVCGARHAWARAAAIVAAGLVAFLGVVALPFVVPGGVPFEVYNPLQNVVFIATAAGLFVLYLREVDAPAAQKAFVFSLVTFFGFFATLTSSNASYLMGLSEQSDGYMYYPPRLAVMVAVYVAFFFVMSAVMRAVGRMLASRLEPATWWRMTALPSILVVTLLLGAWLPPLDYGSMYFTTCLAITVDGVILAWWMLGMVRRANEDAEKRAELEHALHAHSVERESIEGELARARTRVAELERAVAERARDAAGTDVGVGAEAVSADVAGNAVDERPVVLSTARRAVSFMPGEVAYVDSLNRVRAIHFVNGERVEIDMTLSAIVDALPTDRFVYCHRSVVVNLDHVSALSSDDLTLDDGTALPVSRRRYIEVREALSDR